MKAFATIDELKEVTGRTIPPEQVPQVEKLLERAATLIRNEAGPGAVLWPQQQVTLRARPGLDGRWYFPQHPVTDVSVDGTPLTDFDDAYLLLPAPATVTFTVGYRVVPDILRDLNISIAATALRTVELGLGLSVDGISSLTIDDFKVAFRDGGQATDMALTEPSAKAIRALAGASSIYVGGTE